MNTGRDKSALSVAMDWVDVDGLRNGLLIGRIGFVDCEFVMRTEPIFTRRSSLWLTLSSAGMSSKGTTSECTGALPRPALSSLCRLG